MTLYMLQLAPEMPRLIRWAEAQRLLAPHQEDDLGYALHAVLRAAFDGLAPAPFAMVQRGSRPAQVLAYSLHDAIALRAQAMAFADPEIANPDNSPRLADMAQLPDRP